MNWESMFLENFIFTGRVVVLLLRILDTSFELVNFSRFYQNCKNIEIQDLDVSYKIQEKKNDSYQEDLEFLI